MDSSLSRCLYKFFCDRLSEPLSPLRRINDDIVYLGDSFAYFWHDEQQPHPNNAFFVCRYYDHRIFISDHLLQILHCAVYMIGRITPQLS